VRSVTEREVAAGASGDVEAVGVVDERRVAVGGAQADQDLLARRHGDAIQGHARGRDTERGMGHRCGEAQQLLDGPGEQLRVALQRHQLVGVIEQGDDPVADQAAGGVVAGHHELEQR